jgi:hypothetical protein
MGNHEASSFLKTSTDYSIVCAAAPQSTYIQYLEYHSVCPLVGIGTPPPSPASECAHPPGTQGGGGAHSATDEGVGESLFRRLEKKIITLSTLCAAHSPPPPPTTLLRWRIYPLMQERCSRRGPVHMVGKGGQTRTAPQLCPCCQSAGSGYATALFVDR